MARGFNKLKGVMIVKVNSRAINVDGTASEVKFAATLRF